MVANSNFSSVVYHRAATMTNGWVTSYLFSFFLYIRGGKAASIREGKVVYTRVGACPFILSRSLPFPMYKGGTLRTR